MLISGRGLEADGILVETKGHSRRLMMLGRWWIGCIAAVWGSIGLSVSFALAASIAPSTASPGAPAVTLSVLSAAGEDIGADRYLPEVTVDAAGAVTGKPVILRVNPPPPPGVNYTITLQSSTAWPGTCTNYSAPRAPNTESSDTNANGTPKPDFLPVTGNNQLMPLDCGGTAILAVTDGVNNYTFQLPRDANGNGIADSWEAAFGGNLVAAADLDNDGISNFDEYRGFIVSRQLVRGDPTKKDLFVFLVNPQVGAASLSLPAGASLVGKGPTETRIVYPTDGALNAYTLALAPVARVHLIGMKRDAAGNPVFDGLNKNTDEMIDRLASFSLVSGRETWVYRTTDAPAPTITITNLNRKNTPADDRVINKNRRRFDLEPPPPAPLPVPVLLPPQKVVRIIESLDVSKTTPIGSSSWGSPNGLNEAIIYTQRIVNFITGQTPVTSPATPIWYSTHNGQAWGAYSPVDRNFIISRMMQFVFAHEGLGHDIKLTATATSLGFHDPTLTGGMMDSQVQVSTAGDPAGVKFQIPSIYLPGQVSAVQATP